MKKNFLLSLAFSLVWLFVSVCFAIGWGREASYFLSPVYVWWAIIGIALLPGFLMSMMFFSNLLHWTRKEYPETDLDTTVIMCAYNEEANIARAIHAIFNQNYVGRIRRLWSIIVLPTKRKRSLRRKGSFVPRAAVWSMPIAKRREKPMRSTAA